MGGDYYRQANEKTTNQIVPFASGTVIRRAGWRIFFTHWIFQPQKGCIHLTKRAVLLVK
jgi:hypothetical protein